MKKSIFVSLVLLLSFTLAFAQPAYKPTNPSQAYLLAYQAGFPAATHSMNMAMASSTAYSWSVSYYTFNLASTGHISWNPTDYNTYSNTAMGNRFESYTMSYDHQGTLNAAYMSIVASTNFAMMEANSHNGDMELGSYWGYKDGLDAVMLGL